MISTQIDRLKYSGTGLHQSSANSRAVTRADGESPKETFTQSSQDSAGGVNWSQGLRVAGKLAAFAAPAALGAATGDGTLAAGGMLGSMATGVALSAFTNTNDDNIVLLQGLASIVGTGIAAAAGGFGGYTGAAVLIGGLALLGGMAAGLTPSGDPSLPYAR